MADAERVAVRRRARDSGEAERRARAGDILDDDRLAEHDRIGSAISRAMVSGGPPAVVGAMMVMGRDG